jgi:ring-1,2-phenylacetyl-CoA epoxidase subunit PaaE
MSIHFHSLQVIEAAPETRDAIRVRFAVPPTLRDIYRFAAGQFVTLRGNVRGHKVQRAYSICSPQQQYAADGTFDVGIKRVENGIFSSWAHDALRAGQTLDVLPPDGRFTLITPSPASAGQGRGERESSNQAVPQHILAIAAGSGITPILSLIETALAASNTTHFTLLYGNRNVDAIMFLERLEDIKDRWPARFAMHHILSRQAQEMPLFNGRLDAEKISAFLSGPLAGASFDTAFICGPGSMIDAATSALTTHGMPSAQIHTERFASPSDSKADYAISTGVSSQNALKKPMDIASMPSNATQLTVVLDGKEHAIAWDAREHALLDAALAQGLDLPYSCKGGVCCTCRAKLLEGRVAMDKNFTLEQWEIDKGFVLTCQARPLTKTVTVSYDER